MTSYIRFKLPLFKCCFDADFNMYRSGGVGVNETSGRSGESYLLRFIGAFEIWIFFVFISLRINRSFAPSFINGLFRYKWVDFGVLVCGTKLFPYLTCVPSNRLFLSWSSLMSRRVLVTVWLLFCGGRRGDRRSLFWDCFEDGRGSAIASKTIFSTTHARMPQLVLLVLN